MKDIAYSVADWFKDVFSNEQTFASGLIASVVGYFAPIKDPIIYLIALFVVDCLIGALKNWKLHKEPFSKRKVFETTVPRLLAVILIMTLLYSWDKTFQQEFINTYLVVGYFIAGVLLWNVIMNLYKVTKWKAFIKIGSLIDKNVEEKTNLKIEDDKDGGHK